MLCPECGKSPKHRYWCLNRPPGIYCVPDGWALKMYWQPMKKIPGPERFAHGWVEYVEPLEHEVIWKWDLLPDSIYEQLAYWRWKEEENR